MKAKSLASIGILALISSQSMATPTDGTEDFSIDPDPGQGQILFSDEGGGGGSDFTITGLQPGDEIDGLSSHHRNNPWQHNVSLARMIRGRLSMDFSIDNDGNLFEWVVDGPEPVPNGPGRTLALDGHEPATPNPAGITSAHDNEDTLFGPGQSEDIDGHEHHAHPTYHFPGSGPFPGAPFTWEDDPQNVYFSTEKGASDPGDVFNWALGVTTPYLDDGTICGILSSSGGIGGCDPVTLNIDALIVYDVTGDLTHFDAGSDKFTSDAVFFSVAPNAFDPIGDNIYWVSASGVGGLYSDPGLSVNVDSLDVHVPEPATLALLSAGLAGFGVSLRKKRA